LSKFDELKERNTQVVLNISRESDSDKIIMLKKELYQNKLTMLELLTATNQKVSKSARELRDEIKKKKPAIRYETGICDLDINLTDGYTQNGLEEGSMIMLGGQSGAGKSELLIRILSNISKYSKVMFFNFEMGERRLNRKLSQFLKTDEQLDNFIINSDSLKLNDLIMEIELAAQDGIKFFAIDSKMKIKVDGAEAEYQKISKISSTLHRTAIKNEIIILLINQISEEDLKTGRLSFKGSGDQMYDTDMAWFVVINEDGSRKLICTKNRQDEVLFNFILRKEAVPEKVYEQIPSQEPINVEMAIL